eukprot:5199084-Pleurochrysis_carterae.AAC.1
MTDRMARSATPLSSCTWGGHVVEWTPELARVVGVKRTYDLPWFVGVFVDKCGERSDEALDMRRSLRFGPHWVGGFETRVIVHEDQYVLEIGVLRAHEGTGDISVNETSSVRRSVPLSLVGEFDSVGFGACGASVETAGGEGRRCVGRERRQLPEARLAEMQTSMEASSGVAWRHNANVMTRA